jgi:mRNA interferase HigB
MDFARMKVLGRKRLEAFIAKHADARPGITAWLTELEAAAWKTPHELKLRFPKASLVGEGVAIFNIAGNRYRLDALINYEFQQAVIRRIGTHREYDEWEF